MLTKEGCARRQERFRERIAAAGLDAAVISDAREVYYLTGVLPSRFPSLLYLEVSGRSWLVGHADEGEALVEERRTYEWHQLYTLNPDPLRRLASTVAEVAPTSRRPRRVGYQAESLPHLLARTIDDALRPDEWVSIDDLIAVLEKRKDPDELVLLRKAASCSVAAYDAIQQMIAPGVNELAVLAAGQRAAMLEAGEPVEHGGDYRSGEFGGVARDRKIESGEIYIVDAGTSYRGYHSDSCRSFAVVEPTELQRSVYDHIAEILRDVPGQLEPGKSGREVWRWIDRRLREHPHLREVGLIHHAGHGVGLRPHEAPDLNRDREGILEVGDVVSVEPGAYTPALRAGFRLENTFYLSESGVEMVLDYPLQLWRGA